MMLSPSSGLSHTGRQSQRGWTPVSMPTEFVLHKTSSGHFVNGCYATLSPTDWGDTIRGKLGPSHRMCLSPCQ